jgi:hypothetical protein
MIGGTVDVIVGGSAWNCGPPRVSSSENVIVEEPNVDVMELLFDEFELYVEVAISGITVEA